MEFKDLQARLNDPDPWARVEALRILAMVEEIRAMPDIERVFKTDPEPGVRQVAQWAGRIVWEAVKRANNLEQSATPVPEGETLGQIHEAALIRSLLGNDPKTAQDTQFQLLQYELVRGEHDSQNTPSTFDISEPPPKNLKGVSAGLLEAGLSPDLLDYFLREE